MTLRSACSFDVSWTMRPWRNHQDAVGQLEDFVEVFGDEQHGGAAIARLHDARADLGDRLEIEAEAGIGDDQHLHVLAQFAGQHRALDVAAGQVCGSARGGLAGLMLKRPIRPLALECMAIRLKNHLMRVNGGVSKARKARFSAVVMLPTQAFCSGISGRIWKWCRRISSRRAEILLALHDHASARRCAVGRPGPAPVRAGRCPKRRRCRRSRAAEPRATGPRKTCTPISLWAVTLSRIKPRLLPCSPAGLVCARRRRRDRRLAHHHFGHGRGRQVLDEPFAGQPALPQARRLRRKSPSLRGTCG